MMRMTISDYDRMLAAGALREQAQRISDLAARPQNRKDRERLYRIAAERRGAARRFLEGVDRKNIRIGDTESLPPGRSRDGRVGSMRELTEHELKVIAASLRTTARQIRRVSENLPGSETFLAATASVREQLAALFKDEADGRKNDGA
jgi:hypothetical protein